MRNFLRHSVGACDLRCGCETVLGLLVSAATLSGNTPPCTDADFRCHQFHQLFGIRWPSSPSVFIPALMETCTFAVGHGQDYRCCVASVRTWLFRCCSEWGNGLRPARRLFDAAYCGRLFCFMCRPFTPVHCGWDPE